MLKKQARADFFGTKMKWPLWKDKWVNLHNGLNLFYKLNLLISTGDNSYLPGLIPLWCVLKQCLLWNLIVYLAFPATELKFVSTPSILWYIEDITRWREDMNFMFEWQEHKIHIFEPTCNVLFIIWRNQFNKSKRRESWRHWTIRHSQRWHTKNTPLGSRMKWRMESRVV